MLCGELDGVNGKGKTQPVKNLFTDTATIAARWGTRTPIVSRNTNVKGKPRRHELLRSFETSHVSPGNPEDDEVVRSWR